MNKVIVLIILVLLSCIMIHPNFGQVDDGGLLYRLNQPDFDISKLQQSRLAVVHYSVLLALSVLGTNPYVYYGLKLLLACLASFLLFKLCCKLRIPKTYLLSVVLLVFIQPAFIHSFFHLVAGEGLGYIFLLFIAYLLLMLIDDDLKGRLKILICSFLLILSILTVFAKESYFILLLMFSISYLVITKIASGSNSTEVFPGGRFVFFSFIGSSALFLVMYYLTAITPDHTYMETNYIVGNINKLKGELPGESIFGDWVRSVFVSAFCHVTYNPVFVAAPVLVLTRLYHRRQYMDRAKEIEVYRYICWADSLIVASFSFMSFYIVFGLNSPRYLLPAYAFLVPGLCIYARVLFTRKTGQVSLWRDSFPSSIRIAFAFVFLFLLCNSILTGVNRLIRMKYVPFNMSEMIDNSLPAVKMALDTKKDNEDIVFFTIGFNPRLEQFFLLKDQIDISRFKFKDLSCILQPDECENDLIEQLHHGDFIVIIPYSFATNIHETARNIESKFDVVSLHKSPSKYYFQLPTLRILVKHAFNMPSDEVDFYLYQVI